MPVTNKTVLYFCWGEAPADLTQLTGNTQEVDYNCCAHQSTVTIPVLTGLEPGLFPSLGADLGSMWSGFPVPQACLIISSSWTMDQWA